MSVRIVWNAASTFEASNAEVSINDKPFSADYIMRHIRIVTKKTLTSE